MTNPLEIAKEYAKTKDGECLSIETVYKNNMSKFIWKCANPKHKPWSARFSNIVNKPHWCPECGKGNLSEKRTRLIFESFFGKEFPSSWEKWNINPWTNRTLELDGYCKEFNIAFEFDGQHHFELNVFNKNGKKKDLIYQKFKDHQKKKNCIKQGVLLINIPYPQKKITETFSSFLDYVINTCKPYGVYISFTQNQLKELKKDFYLVE